MMEKPLIQLYYALEMLFNSFDFLIFFLPAVLAFAKPFKGQRLLAWLAVASFVFYAFAGHIWFLIPMSISTVMDYFLGPQIAEASDPKKKKRLLITSLTINLGMLCYFKYSGLLFTSYQDVMSLFGFQSEATFYTAFNLVLPAGISFYTFQTISYVVDVYYGKVKPDNNFWRFASFVTFFPQLVAGPLTRHYELTPELQKIADNGIKTRWVDGLFLFAAGLSKKVLIADPVMRFSSGLLGAPEDMTLVTAWLGMLAFTVQIYFDFSGYTDMAIGLARLFGIELPENFYRPYIATDPSDFWRRWHITLSRWLRDYLYIPLGGNRCSKSRQKYNLMMTMFLGGLWHGANWTYAVWGIYHGLLLIIYHTYEKPWKSLPLIGQRALMFFLVMIGWVFFRASSIGGAFTWIGALFGTQGFIPEEGFQHFPLLLWTLLGLGIVWFVPNASHYKNWLQLPLPVRVLQGMIFGAALIGVNHSSSFLYFQF